MKQLRDGHSLGQHAVEHADMCEGWRILLGVTPKCCCFLNLKYEGSTKEVKVYYSSRLRFYLHTSLVVRPRRKRVESGPDQDHSGPRKSRPRFLA